MEQDEVITFDMPHETLEEISMDDEYEDVDDTDSDESDYSDTDESEYSDFQDIDEIEEYNSTNLRAHPTFNEKKRYNLDIIDNKQCRDDMFTPRSYGKRVEIYIIDSGIKYNHNDFR